MTKRVAEQSAREKALADRGTVLRPAPAQVVTRLALTPEEAFVLSRLERPTPVGHVLASCGLPEPRALQILLNLAAKGALLLPGESAPQEPGQKPQGQWGDFVFSPGELNEDVELDVERRKLVLYLFHNLDQLSYYRLLGVSPLAGAADVRKAYLDQSKVFHPDTYFRKRLGGYLPKIEAIFQRMKLAYDTLLDDEARRKYEREKRRVFTPEEQSALVSREIGQLEDEQRQKVRRDSLLRARGFGRLTKARDEQKAGDDALAKGDIAAASQHYQLATELDPRLEEARQKLVETRRVALSRRSDLALDEARKAEDAGDLGRAADLLRNALDHDQGSARVHGALAEVLVRAGEFKEARVHAQRALDLGERSGRLHLAHGQALLKLGLKKNARRELEAAAQLGERERAEQLLKQC